VCVCVYVCVCVRVLFLTVLKVGPENASPARALLRAFRWRLALAQLVLLSANFFGMLGPAFFMYNLSRFAANSNESVGYGIGMAFGFMANSQLMSLCMHKYWIMVSDISSCARSAMIGVCVCVCVCVCVAIAFPAFCDCQFSPL
jgi:hypothetical protein